MSPIVLNIFQLGCTTRPHCPPQDWLPYCLYPPCTLDNCHSLCPCLAVCLFTVALDHLCTFVPLYLHGIQSAGTDSSGALQARHARAWSPPEPDKRRFNYGAGSNFPVKTPITRLLVVPVGNQWRKRFQYLRGDRKKYIL